MASTDPLTPDELRWTCDPASLGFETTAELEPVDDVVGQPRAVAALEFGIGMDRRGYNLFCFGPPGAGKHSIVRSHIVRAASGRAPAPDWVYVHNFDEPHRPTALKLPTGRAGPFRAAMEQLVRELKAGIPAAFESDEYQARRNVVEQAFRNRQAAAFGALQQEAAAQNIVVVRSEQGFAFAPAADGQPMEQDAFDALPEERRAAFQALVEKFQARLQEVMRQYPAWEQETRAALRTLNREVARNVTAVLVKGVRDAFSDLPEIVAYLGRIEDDAVDNVFDFLKAQQEQRQAGETGRQIADLVGRPNELTGRDDSAAFRRYAVNVVVQHDPAGGAPVVTEDAPALGNLIGRVEHTARFGTLVADFSLIKPGALHRANGGFLMVDARKLLMQPMAWDELKRALIAREIRIGTLPQLIGQQTTVTLDPQPIPLNVKVLLIGEPGLYYTLAARDPDFAALFKVAVEFAGHLDRTAENTALYARLIASIQQREKLLPLAAPAVARLLEHAARTVSDRTKLSAQVAEIYDIMREGEHVARRGGRDTVAADDIRSAIRARIYRSDRIRETMYEQIERASVLISTEGAAVGQINGLSVLAVGGFSFGKPSRVSASVRFGKGEVIDIERQVELGGPLHSKGILILQGFLGRRFGQDRPIAMSASLVMEQSYGGVDGDSASSTELYALLSALSGIPIRQSLAVTGSVNQFGEVQAIGGVNEKIEGFFDICRARGLTGEQGVLIPKPNAANLMLRRDVVDACADGRFRVHAVASIDEGIEVLTGSGADTVNARVGETLDRFAERAKEFAGSF